MDKEKRAPAGFEDDPVAVRISEALRKTLSDTDLAHIYLLPKVDRLLLAEIVDKPSIRSKIKEATDFLGAFKTLLKNPFHAIDAGECPSSAFLLRESLAQTLAINLWSIEDAAMNFAAYRIFQKRSSETYLTRRELAAELTSMKRDLLQFTVDDMIEGAALLPLSDDAPVKYTCRHIRLQEELTQGLFMRSVSLFGNVLPTERIPLDDYQRNSVLSILSSPWGTLTGGPGRGKSSVVRALALTSLEAGVSVTIAAPSHKALSVIRNGLLGVDGKIFDRDVEMLDSTLDPTYRAKKPVLNLETVQSLATKGKFSVKAKDHPPRVLLIIDEASMCSLSDLAGVAMFMTMNCVAHQVVLVGDVMQLPPIQRGEVFRHVLSNSHSHASRQLLDCYRSDHLDMIHFVDGIADGVLRADLLSTDGNIVVQRVSDVVSKACEVYRASLNETGERSPVIVALNDTRDAINAKLQETFGKALLESRASPQEKEMTAAEKLLRKIRDPSVTLSAADRDFIFFGKRVFYRGDPVIYIKSKPPTEGMAWLRNGTMGHVESVSQDEMVIAWACGREIIKTTVKRPSFFESRNKRLDDATTYETPFADGIDLAYSITGHKSQGSEYKHAILALTQRDMNVLKTLFDRRWLYTAASRGRERLNIICEDVGGLAQAAGRPVSPMQPLCISYHA